MKKKKRTPYNDFYRKTMYGFIKWHVRIKLPPKDGIYICHISCDGINFTWIDIRFEGKKWIGLTTEKVYAWLEKTKITIE